MRLEIKTDPRLIDVFKININNVVERALLKASLLVQRRAKDIAPYGEILGGTLKRSISLNLQRIKQLYVVVGSPLPYARRRHRENKKNPHTLRYLHRGYEENTDKIKKIFDDEFGTAFRK